MVGIPYRITITVGLRGLAEGQVEVTVRETGESVSVVVGEAVAHVRGLVAEAAVA